MMRSLLEGLPVSITESAASSAGALRWHAGGAGGIEVLAAGCRCCPPAAGPPLPTGAACIPAPPPPAEARDYLRENSETRLVLLDDGMQHLPLLRCGAGGRAEMGCLAACRRAAGLPAPRPARVLLALQGPRDRDGQQPVSLWQRAPAAAVRAGLGSAGCATTGRVGACCVLADAMPGRRLTPCRLPMPHPASCLQR